MRQLLKKQGKVLADNLADSVFTTLADSLADVWRIDLGFGGNPVFMRLPAVGPLADKLADSWRGIIRQSATPFRVADGGGCWVWPMPLLWITCCPQLSQCCFWWPAKNVAERSPK